MAEALDIKEKKERNWVRVAYGFKFLKNGLASFIETQIHQQHDDLIRCLKFDSTNPAKSCASCSSENLLPNHQTRQCIQKVRSKCFCSTWNNRRKCPNQFCSRFYDKIVFAHAEANPSWQNTDPTRWYSDYWELAKCFLGTTGYLSSHSASETDVTGLLSIAINNLFVVNKIDNLDNFKQARDIRNEIFHRKMLQVTDDEVSVYIDRMIDVLQDKPYLLHDVESCQAVDQLNKLKQNEIYISTEDADELRKNALTAISMIREVTEKSKCEIEEAKLLTIRDIELKGSEIEEARLTTIRDIELKGSEIRTDLLNAVSCQTRTTVDDESKTASESDSFGAKMKKKKFGFWDKLTKNKFRLRSDLKEDLMTYYRENESMIPAAPLDDEHKVPIEELYVLPPMWAYDKPLNFGLGKNTQKGKQTPGKAQEKKKTGFSQLFLNGKNVRYRKIYITADAGFGKTSLSQKLTMTWCQAHSPLTSLTENYDDEELIAMKYFDFLFLLHLRDYQCEPLCNLDDLIMHMLSNNLSRNTQYTKEFLQRLLHEKRCIIIFDGLDEWAHPDKCRRTPAVPHNNHTDSCTVLTTSRPWKLGTIGLSEHNIDRHIEIFELDRRTRDKLETNAVRVLNERNLNLAGKNIADFDEAVESVKIGDIIYNPYILLQLMCVFFGGLLIGKSKCEIYSNITEFTLERGLNKKNLPDIQVQTNDNAQVPNCMKENATCKRYYILLMKLGKLAFHTLFSKKRESSLIFNRRIATQYMNEQEIEFCLKVGLLCQTKDSSIIAVKRYHVFFQHKSVHEFFSAIYITSEWQNESVKSTILNVCSSLSCTLEMSNVFVFVCGMNPEVYTCISGELQTIVDLDDVTRTYRTYMDSDNYAMRTMKSYQSMQVQCLQESVRNGNDSCSIYLHDYILTKDLTSLKTIINFNKGNVKSLQLSDSDQITAFMQSLDPGVFISLEKLRVEECREEPVWLADILTESARTLKCLTLSLRSISLSDISITALTGLTCLQSLYLDRVHMTHSNLKCLYAYISQTTTLTQLKLVGIDCSDHRGQYRDCDVTLDLHRLNELKMLHLSYVPCRELHVNPACLEKLKFSPWEKMTARASATLWQDLRAAPVLSSLTLWYMTCCQEMIQTIPTLTQLQYLKLGKFDMGDVIPRVSPEMTHLEHVELYNVKMSSASWQTLFFSICQLPRSITVQLSDITMTSQEWRELLLSVGGLQHLVTVELSWCWGPSKKDWRTIVNVIKITPTLSLLQDLSIDMWGASLTLKNKTV